MSLVGQVRGAAFGGDHLVVDLDEERADELETHWPSGPWTHPGRGRPAPPVASTRLTRPNRSASRPSTDARVVVARGQAIAGPAVRRVTMIGRTLALVTERVDPEGRSLEAGAVSELQGIARFKMPSAYLLSMSESRLARVNRPRLDHSGE